MKKVIERGSAAPIVVHRSGQLITLNQGPFRVRFGVRASPLAETYLRLFEQALERNPELTAEKAMHDTAFELDCAVFASSRRRFRRCFSGATVQGR